VARRSILPKGKNKENLWYSCETINLYWWLIYITRKFQKMKDEALDNGMTQA
jgi:hypothetical protein